MSDLPMLVLSQVEVYSVANEVIFNDSLSEYTNHSTRIYIKEITQLIEYLEKVYEEHCGKQ